MEHGKKTSFAFDCIVTPQTVDIPKNSFAILYLVTHRLLQMVVQWL